MGLRYVWSKWNTVQGIVLSGSSSTIAADYEYKFSYAKLYKITNETFELISPIEITVRNKNYSDSYTVPANMYVLTGPVKDSLLFAESNNKYKQANSGMVEFYNSMPRYKAGEFEKGSTSYGNVSSTSSSAYPANNYSGSYWYVSKGSDTIDPASVTYPASPNGGELIDITIAPSTGIKFGGNIKYKVEYQLNGGSWQTAVTSTTSKTVSVLIPAGTQTFRARATASDNMGFTSTTAVTGETVNVVNNAAPVINCGTSSLGEIAEQFSVTYSVADEDGDTMTITEKIDGTTIRTYSAPNGSSGEQTFSPDAMQWLTTLNGSHTATITADDGKGGVTTHSISFTRAVYTMSVTLEEPMETDAAITKCVVNIARNLPVDAEWSLLVTNNAFDPDPVWEDITQYVKNGWNWVFENQTVTSGRYGFNFKLTCARGASGQGGSVDTISGGFE